MNLIAKILRLYTQGMPEDEIMLVLECTQDEIDEAIYIGATGIIEAHQRGFDKSCLHEVDEEEVELIEPLPA